MKRFYPFLALIIILNLCSFSCKDSSNSIVDDNFYFYRTAAYNSLTSEDKATIVNDWYNQAPVNYAHYVSGEHNEPNILFSGESTPLPYMTHLSNTFEEMTPLITVTFNTTNEALLGPIVIILLEDGTIIGAFGRM